jgi:hypothetical protein
MNMTRQQFVLTIATAAFYWAGQLVTGTDPTVASLFALAILFGILSVFAGGGLRSAYGFLNAMLIGKFLMVAVAIKIALFEPADGTLNAPLTTALVMAIGFMGLFLGTVVLARLPYPRSWWMNRPIGTRMLLPFAIILFVISYLGYFSSMIPATSGEGIQTGGYLGIARSFAGLKSYAIVPFMLYLWQIGSKRWLTHPVMLALLIWGALVGIFSTSKLDALEPIVFYLLVGFLRYGWKDMRLWSLALIGVAYYALLIFPYSQYVRYAGGREGSFSNRLEITKDVFIHMATDRDFRSTTRERVSESTYFGHSQLSEFGRLAMVGEADKLISATERQKAYTGWETIVWGFKLLSPSFLFPDKPIWPAGNYLAHIVGDVGGEDSATQVSYGVMANLYNAFAMPGVLIGTPVFFAGLYYWCRLFVGDATWDGTPSSSTLWFMWVVVLFQHGIVEATISGLVAALNFPLLIAALRVSAKGLCVFLPESDVVVKPFLTGRSPESV